MIYFFMKKKIRISLNFVTYLAIMKIYINSYHKFLIEIIIMLLRTRVKLHSLLKVTFQKSRWCQMKSRRKTGAFRLSVLTDISKKWNKRFTDEIMQYLDKWIQKGLKNVARVNKIIWMARRSLKKISLFHIKVVGVDSFSSNVSLRF